MYGSEDNATTKDMIEISYLTGEVASLNFERARATCNIQVDTATTVDDYDRAYERLDLMVAAHCREVGNIATARLLES